jgi:hypothetical protein
MTRKEQETNEDKEQTTVVKVLSVISHMFLLYATVITCLIEWHSLGAFEK